jgi:diacylglycerol O-acyltransferase
VIAHGGALNITCLSYDGSINFGYIGLRDSLTNMQNLAELSGEALKELEALIKAKTAIQQKTKTKSKRKVKSKTKA